MVSADSGVGGDYRFGIAHRPGGESGLRRLGLPKNGVQLSWADLFKLFAAVDSGEPSCHDVISLVRAENQEINGALPKATHRIAYSVLINCSRRSSPVFKSASAQQ